MIQDYSFGQITINDQQYTKDVEVRWNGEVLDWWRNQGHVFALTDLERSLEQQPEVIILGTGVYGVAQVSVEVEKEMEKLGVELIIEKTGEAVKVFNKEQGAGKKVIGLFHLTC